MFEIWKAAAEHLDQGRNCALATILSVRGSVPRRAGARLLVDDSGRTVGTVGGGSFEAGVLELALRAIETKTSHRAIFTFCFGEMVCGGEGDVLVEFVDPDDIIYHKIIKRLAGITKSKGSAYLISEVPMEVGGWTRYGLKHAMIDSTGFRVGGFPGCLESIESLRGRDVLNVAQLTELGGWEYPVFLEWIKPAGTVYIFGAGHVGVSVARFTAELNFKVVIIDDREEFVSSDKVPDADALIVTASFDQSFADLSIDEDSYVVIVTRGHAHDKTVLKQALRTKARYIGMIGSRPKIDLICRELLEDGFTVEDLGRVHAPIGLDLGGETPQEVALSIVAEIVQVRSGKCRSGETAIQVSPDAPDASSVLSERSGPPTAGSYQEMSSASQLDALVEVGRQILHEGCEQEFCEKWRQQAFQFLSHLLGPQHEYTKLFEDKEACEIKNLLVRANVLTLVRDLVSQGHLPVRRREDS